MSPKKIMFCEDCIMIGVPVPENNDICGNCSSHSVTVYEPVGGLIPRAVDVATLSAPDDTTGAFDDEQSGAGDGLHSCLCGDRIPLNEYRCSNCRARETTRA